MRCEVIGPLLPLLVADDQTLSERVVAHLIDRHVRHCLACQAEVVRYRRARRSTRALAADVVIPPEDAVTATLAALHVGGVVHLGRGPSRPVRDHPSMGSAPAPASRADRVHAALVAGLVLVGVGAVSVGAAVVGRRRSARRAA